MPTLFQIYFDYADLQWHASGICGNAGVAWLVSGLALLGNAAYSERWICSWSTQGWGVLCSVGRTGPKIVSKTVCGTVVAGRCEERTPRGMSRTSKKHMQRMYMGSLPRWSLNCDEEHDKSVHKSIHNGVHKRIHKSIHKSTHKSIHKNIHKKSHKSTHNKVHKSRAGNEGLARTHDIS